jgi:hypothetical protein
MPVHKLLIIAHIANPLQSPSLSCSILELSEVTMEFRFDKDNTVEEFLDYLILALVIRISDGL